MNEKYVRIVKEVCYYKKVKKIIYSIILVFIFICFQEKVFAHTVGQMSFFKVNGVYSELYPVPAKSVDNFTLPQDIAPKTYLVGEPISFELDASRLPFGDETNLKNKIFTWDFGNNDTFVGLHTNYVYKNIGTYFLTIHVHDETIQRPFLIQSMMIHIVPDTAYKLPKAVIAINGFKKDPIAVSFSKDIFFDASLSQKGGSDISGVFWDFGDTKSEKKIVVNHTYPSDLSVVFPVLRIVDKNGFISDAFVQVDNSDYNKQTKSENQILYFFLFLNILLFVLIMGFALYKKTRKKKNHVN